MDIEESLVVRLLRCDVIKGWSVSKIAVNHPLNPVVGLNKNAVQKASNGKPQVKIKTGDIVYVKRPQSAVAKDTKLDWIGPLTVVKTNDHVIKVQTASGDED